MPSISEQFIADMLADAAYVNFTAGQTWPDPTGAPLSDLEMAAALRGTNRFTESQIDWLTTRFEVVAAHSDALGSGFQGVVFREKALATDETGTEPEGFGRSPGRLWIGLRGTDLSFSGSVYANDFLEDGVLAFTGIAVRQSVSMARFLALLQAPRTQGGYGLLLPGVQANFTGHSLGGHLLQWAAIDYGEFFNQGYTFNTANIGGLVSGLVGMTGILPTPAIASRIFNVFNEVGARVVGSFASGVRLGAERSVFSELDPIMTIGNALEQHYISSLTDSLTVYRVFEAAMGTSVDQEAISRILRSASNARTTSLEDAVNSLRTLVVPSFPEAIVDNRDSLMRAAYQLFSIFAAPAATYSLVAFTDGTSEQLLELALQNDSTGTAVRYALLHGKGFAVVGADYSQFDPLGELLDGAYTNEFWADRILFTRALLERNRQDLTSFGLPETYLEDIATLTTMTPGGMASDLRQVRFGTVANDTIVGGTQDDHLHGRTGADDLDGSAGDDSLFGGEGADALRGGTGTNTLDGGLGNDTYWILAGSTNFIRDEQGEGSIRAGAGGMLLGSGLSSIGMTEGLAVDSAKNRYSLTETSLVITTSDGAYIEIIGFTNGDLGITIPQDVPLPTADVTYVLPADFQSGVLRDGLHQTIGWESPGAWAVNNNIEIIDASAQTWIGSMFMIRGSFSDSYITAINNPSVINVIYDDVYRTAFGEDALGDDVGDDVIHGGPALNLIETHGGDDTVYGGAWSDVIVDRPDPNGQYGTVAWVNTPGHRNNDTLLGRDGNDYIVAGAGSAFVDGGAGSDLLMGGAGGDTLKGGADDDFLSGDTRQSDATFYYAFSGQMALQLGTLVGEFEHYARDILDGGSGNDFVSGDGGNDLIHGGSGNDVLMGDYLASAVPFGTWMLQTSASTGNSFNIGSILASRASDPDAIHGVDHVHGDLGNDFIFGGGGADFLYGGGGEDTIYGEGQSDFPAIATQYQGGDQIYGDIGNDVLIGNGGDDYIYGGADNDQIAGDEASGLGGTGNDELHGGAGEDYILGGGGDDRIFGEADHDILSGGVGNDTITAGGGSDAAFGGEGNDTLVLSVGNGHVQWTDTEGANIIRFEGGISPNDVRVSVSMDAGSGGQLVRVNFSATDYAFMTMETFSSVSRFEFSGGEFFDRHELARSFELPTTALGDHALHVSVPQSALSYTAVNDDLVIQYTGSVTNWVDVADLASKRVLYSLTAGSAYGLSGAVLVIHNWYTANYNGYIGAVIVDSNPGVIARKLYGSTPQDQLSVWNLPRTFSSGGNSLIATGGARNDVFNGTMGMDILLGEAGSDDLHGGAGNDVLAGGAGTDDYFIDVSSGADVIFDSGGSGDSIRFSASMQQSDLTFYETVNGLQVVIGAEENGNQILVSNWFTRPDSLIEHWYFASTGSSISNLVIETLISGNRSPVLAAPISDYVVEAGAAILYTLPAETFTDPNGDLLSYSAALADGSALPSWLSFDALTRIFSGTPAQGSPATLEVLVRAEDPYGLSRSSPFRFLQSVSLVGTSSNDVLAGGMAGDHLSGAGGNDTLRGLEGSDVLEGDAGEDTLYGGEGADSLSGGADADILYGEAGDDTLDGGTGNDTLTAGDGADTLRGGAGDDLLGGGDGADTYEFSAWGGSDQISDTLGTIHVAFDSSVLAGDVAVYRTSSATNPIYPDSEHDLVFVLNGSGSQIVVANFFGSGGVAGADVTFANGTVWSYATLLANTVDMSGFIDGHLGTAGDDTLYVDNPADSVNGLAGTDTVVSTVSYFLPGLSNSIEGLTLIGPLNINAYGNSTNNILRGNDANNVLDGKEGVDTLIGQRGDDTYYVDSDIVTELYDQGYDTVYTKSGSYTAPANVERVIALSGLEQYYNTGIYGNALDNWIDARYLHTAAQYTATVNGGLGADTMIGNREATIYYVDDPGDVIIEIVSAGSSAAADWVRSTISYALQADLENLTLQGNDAITGTGNANANELDASPNEAANLLVGGLGDDKYTLGAGDTVLENADEGSDTVRLAVAADGPLNQYSLAGFANVENIEALESAGSVRLIGGASANVVTGNSSDNMLDGQGGDDLLKGGGGSDEYVGFGDFSGDDLILDSGGVDTLRLAETEEHAVSGVAFSRVDNDLVVAISAGNSLRVQSWYASPENVIERLVVYEAGLDFGYSAAQIESAVLGVNGGPTVYAALADQRANVGQAFSIGLAENMFGDIESQHALVYAATLADGSALPSWLSFNASTRVFSGTPGPSDRTTTSVRVTATDAGMLSSSDIFDIRVGPPLVLGTGAADVILGDATDNALVGLGGNDTLSGLGGNDELYGDAGDDMLDGGSGADEMRGGVGNDVYVTDAGDVLLEDADSGIDEVRSTVALTLAEHFENLTLLGSTALSGIGNELDNVLVGNSGNNTLSAGNGNDLIDGGGGSDSMAGGDGDDTYVTDGADTATEYSGEGEDTVHSTVTYTLSSEIENLTLLGTGNISGTGNGDDNMLTGNAGNNTLNGMAGEDVLSGGAGNDTYVVNTRWDEVLESGDEGIDTVQSQAGYYGLGDNVENLTLTGSAQSGSGNDLANTITGNSTSNYLEGHGGNDVLNGGAGDDTLYGGTGNDTYTVDSVDDWIEEYEDEGVDLIHSSISWTLSDNVENLTLTGSSGLSGTGNALNNVLTGNGGNNELSGGEGNDTLNGGLGNDTMTGGLGDDIFVVANASDVVVEAASEGTDLVQSSVTHTLANNVENLTLTGSSLVSATGNSLNNTLIGNTANNTLTGAAGNDSLDGAGGSDTMVGGQGNDIYYVDVAGDATTESANEGTDIVNSMVTRTLGSNIEILFLGGASAINGTGNALANFLRGNGASNTLVGGGGADILQGGDGIDTLSNTSGNTLLDGGAGNDVLTGSSAKDLLIGGTGNDALTTGSGADLILFNKGDGLDSVASSTTRDNMLSIGGGSVYADLLFQKSGNDLVLKVGGADQITLAGYYTSTANRSVDKLQIIIEDTADYDVGSADALRNKKIETFNFEGLVAAFDTARAGNPSLTTWALTNALTAQHLSGSDTAAIGGDLGYRYGRFGALSDISFSPAGGILGAADFATSAQALHSLTALQDTTPRLS